MLVVPFPAASLNSGLLTEFTALKFKFMLRALAWYCGWLNRLKKSNWNCIFTRSVILKCFLNDPPTSMYQGPEQILTPEVPIHPSTNPILSHVRRLYAVLRL